MANKLPSRVAVTVAMPDRMKPKEIEEFVASLDLVGLAKTASEIEIVEDSGWNWRDVSIRFSVRSDEQPAIVLTRIQAKKRRGKR